MKSFKTAMTRFVRDEEGATAAEYGLIAALIAIAVITAAGTFGSTISGMFSKMGTTVGAVKTSK